MKRHRSSHPEPALRLGGHPTSAFALVLMLLFVLASGPFTAQAQPSDGETPAEDSDGSSASVRIVATPQDAVPLGTPVVFQLRTTLPEGAEFLSLRPIAPDQVEVVDVTHTPDEEHPFVDSTLVLTVYRPGQWPIDGFEAVWIDTTDTQHRTRSEPLVVQFSATLANEQEPTLREAGPFVMVRTHNIIPVYLAAGFGAALLLTLLVVLLRRRRFVDVEADKPPPRPEHEVALESLAQLEQSSLLDEGHDVAYHTALSEILRVFIGRRYGFHAREMTTTEIRASLDDRKPLVGGYREGILEILAETDTVKFAKFAPPRDLSERLLEQTRSLVEEMSAREIEAAARAEEADDADVPKPPTGEFPRGASDEDPSVSSRPPVSTSEPTANEAASDEAEPPSEEPSRIVAFDAARRRRTAASESSSGTPGSETVSTPTTRSEQEAGDD